jgi:hypothetical protein
MAAPSFRRADRTANIIRKAACIAIPISSTSTDPEIKTIAGYIIRTSDPHRTGSSLLFDISCRLIGIADSYPSCWRLHTV